MSTGGKMAQGVSSSRVNNVCLFVGDVFVRGGVVIC